MEAIYDRDIDRGAIEGKTIAILGYGSQGRAHALNLRDSGCKVVVGLRGDSKSRPEAQREGLEVAEVAEAVRRADITMVLIPDEEQPAAYKRDIEANLKPGVSHLYAKRVFYIDEDTWQILTTDCYDQRGQLWRVGDSYGLEYYQVPVYRTGVDSIYDLQSGRYTAVGFSNETAPTDFSVKLTPEDFTPETLRNAGVR